MPKKLAEPIVIERPVFESSSPGNLSIDSKAQKLKGIAYD
jgi:hypothetical protein